MASGLDGVPATVTDIGQLFRELRRCLRSSLPELAHRLETRIDVIEALEAGDIRRLPPWPETVRVVSAYLMLARIDPRPVLHFISERIAGRTRADTATRRAGRPAEARTRDPESPGPVSRMAGAVVRLPGRVAVAVASRSAAFAGAVGRVGFAPARRPAVRWLLGILVVVGLMASIVPFGMQQASAVGGGSPLARMFAGLQEYLIRRQAPVVEGHRVIEVTDPRARRSDKLRSAER